MGKWFNWPPLKLYAIDADTGKPIDPNVRQKTYVKYYEVGKNSKGQPVLVAAKSEKGQQETSKDNSKKGKPEATKQDSDKKGDQPAAGNANNSDRKWTSEEDEKLKEMKMANSSWKDIAAALKRSQSACRARYKELGRPGDPQAANAKENGKDKTQEKKDDGKTATDKKQNQGNQKNSKKKNQQSEKEEQAQIQKAVQAAEAADKDARLRALGWLTLREDDVFSSAELQTLARLYEKDNTQSWLRLASAFYDKTGRRVHPDDIRDKFEELGVEA